MFREVRPDQMQIAACFLGSDVERPNLNPAIGRQPGCWVPNIQCGVNNGAPAGHLPVQHSTVVCFLGCAS